VGICPAFSCASRAALSPASWVAFSFEWNVPAAGVALGVAVVAAVVAELEVLGLAVVAACEMR
jgi:hypothetical protein